MSFGHPLNPSVATLGINPSSREFLDRNGALLRRAGRRLATLESLGLAAYDEITSRHAELIVDDCASYFGRKPYAWFRALDRVLVDGLGVSYFDKTACHLDLVQWATEPFWGELDARTQQNLLKGDREFLTKQLRHESYRVVVVAGRTSMNWVEKAGLVRWKQVVTLEDPTAGFCLATAANATFIGWTCNLQSQPGARRHTPRLADLLKEHALDALA